MPTKSIYHLETEYYKQMYMTSRFTYHILAESAEQVPFVAIKPSNIFPVVSEYKQS